MSRRTHQMQLTFPPASRSNTYALATNSPRIGFSCFLLGFLLFFEFFVCTSSKDRPSFFFLACNVILRRTLRTSNRRVAEPGRAMEGRNAKFALGPVCNVGLAFFQQASSQV
eukprot:749769-Hanusia_phi.AAC.3